MDSHIGSDVDIDIDSNGETYRFAPPYELPTFPFDAPAATRTGEIVRYPVVIVGAGPAGLTLACDLACRGITAVLLDEDDTVGVRGASSRGICHAQKSLEIHERLGIGQRIMSKGVTWSFGRTFSGDTEVYSFNLETASVSAQPPFVNLQQFYLEWFLVDRIIELGKTDVRWKNSVSRVEPQGDHVHVWIDTPAGSYELKADILIDATGANSRIRTQLGIETNSSRSTDRWCITDVKFDKPLPTERWTWVDAPFNDGRGVWQHLMGDDVWRIDYQMAEDSSPEEVSRPEVAGSRLRRQLGPGVEFEFVWIGPYQYRDHLLDDFRHGRVFFIGDAAHVVSPFGARGGNTGVQDAANLGWKLAMVLAGDAPESLLDSYNAERRPAAAENLEVTSRSARFLAPRTPAEHRLRRAIVDLARKHPFARTLVNTGRMSVPNSYPVSPWLPEGARSVQNVRLADREAAGDGMTLNDLLRAHTHARTQMIGLWFEPDADPFAHADRVRETVKATEGLPLKLLAVGGASVPESALSTVQDAGGRLAKHLMASPGDLCIVRPDGYLARTLHSPKAADVTDAVQTMFGRTGINTA